MRSFWRTLKDKDGAINKCIILYKLCNADKWKKINKGKLIIIKETQGSASFVSVGYTVKRNNIHTLLKLFPKRCFIINYTSLLVL